MADSCWRAHGGNDGHVHKHQLAAGELVSVLIPAFAPGQARGESVPRSLICDSVDQVL